MNIATLFGNYDGLSAIIKNNLHDEAKMLIKHLCISF